MEENNKIIRAAFTGNKFTKTSPAYQYDTGHLLQLDGFDLPESYDVHFSHNVQDKAVGVRDCSGNTVRIPDELFTEAQNILCWICFRSESNFFTLYEIRIPVLHRPLIPMHGKSSENAFSGKE